MSLLKEFGLLLRAAENIRLTKNKSYLEEIVDEVLCHLEDYKPERLADLEAEMERLRKKDA